MTRDISELKVIVDFSSLMYGIGRDGRPWPLSGQKQRSKRRKINTTVTTAAQWGNRWKEFRWSSLARQLPLEVAIEIFNDSQQWIWEIALTRNEYHSTKIDYAIFRAGDSGRHRTPTVEHIYVRVRKQMFQKGNGWGKILDRGKKWPFVVYLGVYLWVYIGNNTYGTIKRKTTYRDKNWLEGDHQIDMLRALSTMQTFQQQGKWGLKIPPDDLILSN